jgi:hypothetical protein
MTSEHRDATDSLTENKVITKVNILSVTPSDTRSGFDSVVIEFLHEGVVHLAFVYPGQDFKVQIREAITKRLTIEIEKLTALSLVEKLKHLEGTEIEID